MISGASVIQHANRRGVPKSAIVSGGVDADWIARSTQASVILAKRMENAGDFPVLTTPGAGTSYVLGDGLEDHVSLDTTLACPGALGSAKFQVLNADGPNNGNIAIYFGGIRTFGNGDTVWTSYRIRAPANMGYQPWPASSGESAHKLSILSHSSGSNQANEIVPAVGYNQGLISCVYQDGVSSALPPDVAAVTNCSASDFKWQPSVDHGVNPLVGTDPDTGSAWSSCAQDRARYGGLYAAKTGTSSKMGFGDPLTGGFRQYPDEWITITMRVVIGTFGTFSNRLTMWCARLGSAYTQIFDEQNIRLGAGPNYNTLWLLPYVTNRTAGGRKVSSRTNSITGATILVVGLSTTVGVGTLEYVASTGLFRWKGAGEAYGTARGYSAANGILTINVASTTTDSYLTITVVAASLPSAGTITDTVTIASGRPDTQINYGDVIVSTQPINAPGGYVPLDASPLAVLAASMVSGDWADFTMGGLDLPLIDATAGHSVVEFCARGQWDPLHKKIQFWGQGHNANEKSLVWDDATNQWSLGTIPNWGGIGHSYYHQCCDPATGDLYVRQYSTMLFKKKPYGAAWSSIASATNIDGQVAGGVEWLGGLNSGVGGVAFCSVLGIQTYNPNTNSWTTISSTLSGMGPYHNWMARAGGSLYFGGGNGSSVMYKLTAAGVLTSVASTPLTAGIWAESGSGNAPVIAHPDGNQLLQFAANNASGTGAIHLFDGTSWASHGTQALTSATNGYGWFATPISDYGVVLFISQAGSNVSNPVCRVYKP